ncbi:MAG: OmpA family protein [Spirochaetota bacterium]|nr:OmpA family protein [Spirochaetota bacterium]
MTQKFFNIHYTFIIILSYFFIPTLAVSQVISVDKISNIGSPINTMSDDFSPSLTADEKIIVFNSKRENSRYQDLYISYFNNDGWSNPEPLTALNSLYNDETPYITLDGAFIFFSSDRDGSYEMPANSYGQIKVSYDLYVSKNVNGKWANPIKIPGTVNGVHHERSPSLSMDSNTLYYTTWPFGDISKAKIMSAKYVNGEFINSTPMPSPINMNTQDIGLIPSLDGKGFYFSSSRPGGYGGWDLYYINYQNGKFGKTVNLGPEINSEYNETHLSIINESLYFCSNRQNGYGLYDIYSSNITKDDLALNFFVRDKKTQKPSSVQMHISTRIKESEDKSVTYEIKKQTDTNGEAIVEYQPQAKKLDVFISEDGYLPLFKSIDIPETKGETQLLELVPIEKEASFEIHAIHFDFESSRIKPESFPYLNALVEYLRKNPTLRFEIIGHTDLHGSHKFNNKLSMRRAQAVTNYLVARGLDGNRFIVRGAGKTKPLIPKLGAGYDEKNRRTEFKLLNK